MSAQPPPDFYRPPPVGGPTTRGRLRLRAVAYGVAVDWLGTIAASFAIVTMASLISASRYRSQAEMEAFLERLTHAPDFVILSSVVGLACVALGGYVAGRLAPGDELRHAFLVGAASLGLGLAFQLSSSVEPTGWSPTWFRVLTQVMVVPAAFFGGLGARALLVEDPAEADRGEQI